MKKNVFLFLTFLGICTASAQKTMETIPSDSSEKIIQRNDRAGRNDSLRGKEKPLVRLFPNPAVNKVEIEIKGFDPGYVQVQIIDMNGTSIRNDKRLVFKGDEIIVLMFSINPGVYLLQVHQNKKQGMAKLIVK